MPELPEVETIVRYLRPRVRGKRILEFEPLSERVCRDHRHPAEVKRAVTGQRICGVARAGKNIVFTLSNGTCLLIHLMMTGRLWWNPSEQMPHDRLRLWLSGGNQLVFNDPRQFGRCRIVDHPSRLVGENPLSVSFEKFKRLIRSRKGVVKSLLLNQNILAGIGNIYADEILWQAGIHPLRKASTLADRELGNFYQSCRSVLVRAIRMRGSSMRFYRKPDGKEGGYYETRSVYQRTGERCSRDGARIQKIVVGQRCTHFCPKHQK